MRYLIATIIFLVPNLLPAETLQSENNAKFVMFTIVVGLADVDVIPHINDDGKSVAFRSLDECEAALLSKMKTEENAAVWIEQETFSKTLYIGSTRKQSIETATTCMVVID